MGEGVNEATIVKWLKKKGEKIEKDEPLIEISTDKVDTEVTSPSDGYLIAVHCQEGSVVQVDQIIAHLGKRADIAPPALNESAQTAENFKSKTKPSQDRIMPAQQHQLANNLPLAPNLPLSPGAYAGAVRSSPLVKKMAREYGLNLNMVPGTGLYGRITKRDVLSFMGTGGNRHLQANSVAESSSHQAIKTTVKGGQEYLEGVLIERKKMSKIRKLTSEHMQHSVKTSPHVTTTFEVDLERISILKSEISEKFLKEHGQKLTYTSFFIAAAIFALKQHPEMNASVDADDILYKEAINIGCAVAIDTGLIVPVIKNANNLSLGEIAKELGDLVFKARNKKLSPDDVTGGTFSITNPGMYGSIHSQPIINQPQVGIMSIGAIVKRPMVINDEIVIHPLCQIGVTFDHRIIDGEGGAKFLADVKNFLENYQ